MCMHARPLNGMGGAALEGGVRRYACLVTTFLEVRMKV